MEMEKKLLLEKVYGDYVNNDLNGDWIKEEVGGYDMEVLIREFKNFRLYVSGGEKRSMGSIGMGSIGGFIREIEWYDNMMSDWNGVYRGDFRWEMRDWLFEILDRVIEDEMFRNEVKEEYNGYFRFNDDEE